MYARILSHVVFHVQFEKTHSKKTELPTTFFISICDMLRGFLFLLPIGENDLHYRYQ